MRRYEMPWSHFGEDDITRRLRDILTKKVRNCHGAPPAAVAERFKKVSDLVAELEGGGIQFEGYKTKKIPDKYDRKYAQYIMTKDTLPADTCFVCLETLGYGYGLDFSANIDGIDTYAIMVTDKNFGFIFRFLKRFEKIVEQMPECRAECEKQKKAEEFVKDSYNTWLERICKELTLPYAIERHDTKSVLWVKVDDETQFEITIPYNGFQEVMPEVLNTLKSYEYLYKTSKTRVLIKNCRYILGWKTNPPAKE